VWVPRREHQHRRKEAHPPPTPETHASEARDEISLHRRRIPCDPGRRDHALERPRLSPRGATPRRSGGESERREFRVTGPRRSAGELYAGNVGKNE
jgi:hypothetical protein